MKNVGEILKEARIKKGFSLEEVEKATKIRVRFLQAIEENNFSQIPQAVTTRGFIRNFAKVLDLNPEGILAIFRRDFQEDEKGQIIPRGIIAPLDKFNFFWTPKLTTIAIIVTLLVIFFAYLLRQYLNFVSSPKIIITYPLETEILTSKEVEFLGKTDKDASFYINGEIVSLKENGEFSKKINLINGENEIIFESINRKGKKTRVVKKYKVEIP